jgi:hypothetical protein
MFPVVPLIKRCGGVPTRYLGYRLKRMRTFPISDKQFGALAEDLIDLRWVVPTVQHTLQMHSVWPGPSSSLLSSIRLTGTDTAVLLSMILSTASTHHGW